MVSSTHINKFSTRVEVTESDNVTRRHELFPNVINPNVKIPIPENGENPEFFGIIFGIIFSTMLGEGERH